MNSTRKIKSLLSWQVFENALLERNLLLVTVKSVWKDSIILNSETYVVLVWKMPCVQEVLKLMLLKDIGGTIYFKRPLFLVMKNLLVLEVIILIKNILLNVLLDIRATCAKIAFTMRLFTIKDLEDQNVVYVRQSLRTLLELLVSVFSSCS